MKHLSLLPLALVAALAGAAGAQDTPAGETVAPVQANPGAAARVVQIDEDALATLPALLARGGPSAISLRVSGEAFAANAGARRALLAWVSNGGTVFLHTAAARAFGFQTIAARAGTKLLAGQLFGRARAALPFGANPLLWDDGSGDGRRAPGADPTRFPGVNVVFYQMQQGDHLVVSHPAGTPLLEVSDLTGTQTQTLYAAALAPFGRGFAIFTPDLIDQNRGDGALFARNLLALVSPSPGRAQGANVNGANAFTAAASARLVAVPASAIRDGGVRPADLQKALAAAADSAMSSPALPAFGTTPFNGPGQTPIMPPMDAPETDVAPGEGAAGAGVMGGGAIGDLGNEDAAGQLAPGGAGIGGGEIGGGPIGGAADDEAPVAGDDGDGPPAEAVVLLSGAEADSYSRLIAQGGDEAGAAINLLRARLFLGRGDIRGASASLEASEALAPDSAELALWRGILQIGAAQNRNQPSPARAELLQGGARNLAQAAGSASVFSLMERADAARANMARRGATAGGATAGGATTAGARTGANSRAAIGGIPVATLRNWSARLGQIAQVFALEPPFVGRYGVGDNAIIVRAAADSEALSVVVPGVRALADARSFGWHADGEEILLFPNVPSLLLYRRALGLTGPTVPLPASAAGDVLGQRISMLADPFVSPLTLIPGMGQGPNLANRDSASTLLARLHSYVLLGAYDEAGLSPAWLQLGLENLANIALTGDVPIVGTQTLEQIAQVGGLMTPEQFRGVAGARAEVLALAQAQSAAMMAFFYRAYGAGTVTETVQRLGTGQSIDDALLATTDGDQLAFFQNWRDAQFGPRNFPNRP